MRVRIAFVAAGLMLAGATPLSAGQGSIIVGVAASNCAVLAGLVEADPAQAEQAVSIWLDGFLSGFNFAINEEVSKAASINLNTSAFPDASVRYQWLRSSCRAHPERPLFAHAANLYGIIRNGQ